MVRWAASVLVFAFYIQISSHLSQLKKIFSLSWTTFKLVTFTSQSKLTFWLSSLRWARGVGKREVKADRLLWIPEGNSIFLILPHIPDLFLILCLSASFSFSLLPTVEGRGAQTHFSRISPGRGKPVGFSWVCLCSPGLLWVLVRLREIWCAHSNPTLQEGLLCNLSLDTEITMAIELSGAALRGTMNSWGHLLKIEAISRAF